ncbi:hypothetical protein [Chitinophaga sp. XS-30]|uniref:hypothetical protein n=1 Tax=Chitinophaga sp. XS-30 TaxID=2604421 RepID=UPI0011DCFF35|nr:hypothetical protein [Chitinophaga sp. XS-30]QEH39991.1 hypothetical protein FW415_03560 [Chitinophaga sp. XS-30]
MVESYVLGLTSPEESAEMAFMLEKHPELRTELEAVERTYHRLCFEEAVLPPRELRERTLKPYNWADTDTGGGQDKQKNYTFINIQPNKENYITVHKVWKWILLTAFLLFKFCLFLAIYFYFKYRQVEERRLEREKIRIEQQMGTFR